MRTVTRTGAALAGLGLAATGLAVTGLTVTAAPADAASCYARNGHLYCGNKYAAQVRSSAAFTHQPGRPTRVVDRLRSTHSYFKCYTYGQKHSGGNRVWYYTYGDDTGRWGYVPASEVYTWKDPFPGVKRC